MTVTNHGKRRVSPSSNPVLRDTFRIGTVAFSLAVAWFAFRPAATIEGGLPWDKANHAVAFLTWTVLAACGWPRNGLVRSAGIMLGAGIAIELIQGLPAVGRDADVWDVVADMVGFALGWGLLTAVQLRSRLGLRE